MASASLERVKSLSCFAAGAKIRSLNELRAEGQEFGDARTNENFIVEENIDGQTRRSFVRIGADLPFYGVYRRCEHAATRAAADVGVSPKVKHTELPDAMVVEFVAGKTFTEKDFHEATSAGVDNPVLKTVMGAIHKLHKSPVPEELGKTSEQLAGGKVGWGGPHFAKWLAYAEDEKYTRLPILDGVRELIARLERAAGPLATPKFCHFDLLADNFVLGSNGQAMIVDFEYAAPGQPLMDLAVLAMGCSLTPPEENNLLASFLNVKKVSTSTTYRFSAIKVIAALRETFWGITGELSASCALSPEEAKEYADMNYEKFKSMLEDFEKLPVPKAPKGKKVYDYSGLEKGMRVRAESEGYYYAAEVLQVSNAERRTRAPVKVSYFGYEGYNEWVGGDRLRSKALVVEAMVHRQPGTVVRGGRPERIVKQPVQLATASEIPIGRVARVYRAKVSDEAKALQFDALVNATHLQLIAEKQGRAKGYLKMTRHVCKTEWAYECSTVWRSFDDFKAYEESEFGKAVSDAFSAKISALITGDLYTGVRVWDELSAGRL